MYFVYTFQDGGHEKRLGRYPNAFSLQAEYMNEVNIMYDVKNRTSEKKIENRFSLLYSGWLYVNMACGTLI